MGNNGGLIIFLFMIIVLVGGGVAFFYTQFQPPTERTVTCKNDWSSISFLINDEEGVLLMNGELVSPESIKISNSMAISAQWRHDDSATKFFLDRAAGTLIVETTDDFLEWEKNEFTCISSQKRF